MQKLKACEKCNSKNIEYNLWGMPSEEGMKELEKTAILHRKYSTLMCSATWRRTC